MLRQDAEGMMQAKLLGKLGWRPGRTMLAVGRPETLLHFAPFPATPEAGPVDVRLGFAARAADVQPLLDALLPRYARGGRLWLAYPKKSGAIRTDLSRDKGWAPLAARDLLPVTQVALDETWSALRFRYRDEIRVLTRRGA
jgi:hypothetical protein